MGTSLAADVEVQAECCAGWWHSDRIHAAAPGQDCEKELIDRIVAVECVSPPMLSRPALLDIYGKLVNMAVANS